MKCLDIVNKGLAAPLSVMGGESFIIDVSAVRDLADGATDMLQALKAIAEMSVDADTDYPKLTALMQTVAATTLAKLI
jgi:hypothetical protein